MALRRIVCCPDPAAASSPSGSKNHRAALYCRQADFAAAGCVSKILRRADARRALRGASRSACQAHGSRLLICVNLQISRCAPQWPFPVSDLKFIGTRSSRSAAVGGRQVGLLEPIWFHWDQPHAQERPLRRPAGTAEFQTLPSCKTPGSGPHLHGVRPRAQHESGHLKSGRPDSRTLHPFSQEAAL